MLTKQAFALLALGGEIRAWRVFPHPYHYGVTCEGQATVELTEDDVVGMLARKQIAAPTVSEFGDSFGYRVLASEWVRAEALRGFKFGFGCCTICGAAPIGCTAQGVAARHGFSKHDPAPCEGSGKALARIVSHEGAQAQRAA